MEILRDRGWSVIGAKTGNMESFSTDRRLVVLNHTTAKTNCIVNVLLLTISTFSPSERCQECYKFCKHHQWLIDPQTHGLLALLLLHNFNHIWCCVPLNSWTGDQEITISRIAFHSTRQLVNSCLRTHELEQLSCIPSSPLRANRVHNDGGHGLMTSFAIQTRLDIEI